MFSSSGEWSTRLTGKDGNSVLRPLHQRPLPENEQGLVRKTMIKGSAAWSFLPAIKAT